MNNKQAGWRSVALGQIITPLKERETPTGTTMLPYIGMEHVQAESGVVTGRGRASVIKSLSPRVRGGDVLYGRLRPYLNKVAIAPEEAFVSGEFIVFRGSEILDARWLKWRLTAPDFVEFASSLNTGERPRVKWSQMASFRLVLPPVDEQRRIVESLEYRLSRIDAGVNYLQASTRRCAHITESWLRHSLRPVAEENRRMADVIVESRGGWSRSRGHLVSKAEGTPYLKMNNISRTGDFVLDEVVHVAATDVDLAKYQINVGDVLFNSKNSGDLIGKAAVADHRVAGWVFNENIMRLRFGDAVSPEYAGLWLLGPQARRQIMESATASTNVAAVYFRALKEFAMWVPDLGRQARLVAEYLDRRSDVVRLRNRLETQLRRSEELRRSVLTEAFRVELTGLASTIEQVEETAGV